MSTRARTLPLILALPILLLGSVCGGDDDDGWTPPEEVSWFDDQGDSAHARDNYAASGWFHGTEADLLLLQNQGGVVETTSNDLYPVQTEFLFTYGSGDFHSFITRRDELPIPLMPGTTDLQLGWFGAGNPILAEHAVTTAPEMILLPVHTWVFVSEEDGIGVDVDERAAKYAFDKAPSTRLPDEYEVAPGDFVNYETNYWAHERVDQLWAPCNIQFRHIEHHVVTVPWCKSSAVMALDSGWGRCHNVPDDECSGEGSVDCPEYNRCTIGTYITHMGYHVEGAINVYFFRSFDPSNHPLDYGVNCGDWVYLNDALREGAPQDQPGRRTAHEIGHALGLNHEAGTLMAWTVQTYNDVLTDEQCAEARTAEMDLIAGALTGG